MKTTNTKNCLSHDVSLETKLLISNFLLENPSKYSDQIIIRLSSVEKVLNGLFNIAILSDEESDDLITNDFILGLSALLASEVSIIKILAKGAAAEEEENSEETQ